MFRRGKMDRHSRKLLKRAQETASAIHREAMALEDSASELRRTLKNQEKQIEDIKQGKFNQRWFS